MCFFLGTFKVQKSQNDLAIRWNQKHGVLELNTFENMKNVPRLKEVPTFKDIRINNETDQYEKTMENVQDIIKNHHSLFILLDHEAMVREGSGSAHNRRFVTNEKKMISWDFTVIYVRCILIAAYRRMEYVTSSSQNSFLPRNCSSVPVYDGYLLPKTVGCSG